MTDDCREDQTPPSPDRPEPEPAGPLPALSGSVELSRLVALARLTAPQALEIGASVLAEAARQPEADAGSLGSDRFADQVRIGADGQAFLGPTAGGAPNRNPAARPAGSAVEAVLSEVAAAARLDARRTAPAEHLLAELDQAVTELPVVGIPATARSLREATATIDRRAVRAELAALVRAIDGAGRPVSDTAPVGGRPGVVGAALAGRATTGKSAGSATDRKSRTATRRIGAWVLSILVLAAVVLLEVGFLRDHIATDIGVLLDAGRSGSSPSAAPKPDGLPVAPPAPAAAGTVTAVDLRPLGPCAPGAPCTVRLLVRLVPAAHEQKVTWTYRIVDRCTGATDTAPGGTIAVPAGDDQAAAVGTVTLPAKQAAGVIAVTSLPAAAASPPTFVGSCAPARNPE